MQLRSLAFSIGGFAVLSVVVPALAVADPQAKPVACPSVVVQAVTKAFPGSTQTACKPEHGTFEVKLTKQGGGAVEVDVGPDGTILQLEEIVPLSQLPAAVSKAFATKYPKGKITRVEKMTKPGKGSEFELLFSIDGKTKEVTFDATGKFIEEE